MRTIYNFGVAALACAALAACDDSDPTGIPDGESRFEVQLAAEAGTSASSLSRLGSVVSDPLRARLSLESVSSIVIPIGAVQARAADGAWVDAGTVGDDIDFLALTETGITLVDGSLPEGDYTGLRLFLDGDATITLSETLTVGRAVYEAGTYTLRIPSSDQSGIKLNADFEVDGDGQLLTVLFDEGASVDRVTATGSGVLMISPVLHVRDEDGADIGEIDDEDDDDGDVEFEGLVATTSDAGFTLSDGTVVVIGADTRIEGDILTLAAVAEALANGEEVEAEGEGFLDTDGETVLATKVEFETDDDDGDGDTDDTDEEVEVEGTVTSVDAGALSFVVDDDGVAITVLVTSETEIDTDGDFTTFAAMVAAFEASVPIEAEAEGELDAEGRLVADEVEFETGG